MYFALKSFSTLTQRVLGYLSLRPLQMRRTNDIVGWTRGLMAVIFCASFTVTAHAQAGPFTCDGEIYQVQSGQLRIFDANQSAYVDVGPQNGAYNATGFNTQDNFAYGAQGQDIIRIHRDGFIEDVFTNIGHTSFSGDVDDNNTLWLRRTNNRYIGYNLSTGAATDITFSGSFIGCLLYTSPSPRDQRGSRMPSSA